jgi:hypothetical protein
MAKRHVKALKRDARRIEPSDSVMGVRSCADGSRHPSSFQFNHCPRVSSALHKKLASVRSVTANSPPPLFTAASAGCTFDDFWLLNVDDVAAATRQQPDQ